MRITLSSGFQRITACLLAGLLTTATATAWADPYSPMYAGYSLSVKDTNYSWVSASEDASNHYDLYQDSNGSTLYVTGSLYYNSLALVSGPGIDGHLASGYYQDNVSSWGGTGSYTAAGFPFTEYSTTTTYYPDISTGSVLYSSSSTYSGSNGSYNEYTDTTGVQTWSLNVSGTETGLSGPQSGLSSFTQFGVEFTFDFGERTYSSNQNGTNGTTTLNWDILSTTDRYLGPDGAWLNIYHYRSVDSNLSAYETSYVEMYSPFHGNLSTSLQTNSFSGLSSLTWFDPYNARFGPGQIWVRAKTAAAATRRLLTWQSTELTSAGGIIDHYSGGGLTVDISGTPGGGNPEVSVNGSSNGVWEAGPGFSNTGDYEILTAGDWGTQAPQWISEFPAFAGATLWVDGTPYPFREGYQDASGTRVDVYVNPSAGNVTLSGNMSDTTNATVQISHLGSLENAAYEDSDFVTYYFLVTKTYTAPVYGPFSFWVEGRLLTRAAPGSSTYSAGADTLSLNSNGVLMTLTGTVGGVNITGQIMADVTGLQFMQNFADNTLPEHAKIRIMRAGMDGSPILGAQSPPEGFPPAVMAVGKGLWRFFGSVTASGATTAYYGSAAPSGPSLPVDARDWLLAVHTSGSATLANLFTGNVYAGVYSTTSHLFQLTPGTPNALPMPLLAVNSTNGVLWGLDTLPAGLPPTFVVRGQPWRYAGTDGSGNTAYHGLYTGQVMTVGPETEGGRLVTLTDPVFGQSSTGSLAAGLNSLRLEDGTLVASGNEAGTAQPVQPPQGQQVHTITGDLDLVGNNISFGILQTDSALAGALLQFSDVNAAATLDSTLSRSNARWVWNRVTPDSTATLPVMKVDAQAGLSLQNPATPAAAPTVSLDPRPDQPSKLPKLELTAQTANTDSSVITRSLGDSRYLRATDAPQNVNLTGTLNINTGGTSGTANTVASGGIALGQNLQSQAGQVVLGRHNATYYPNDIFAVGAGTSAEDQKTALRVDSSGNTIVAGGLAVNGTASLGNLSASQASIYSLNVSGSLAVSGSFTINDLPVLTTATGLTASDADSSYLRKNGTSLAWPDESTLATATATGSGAGAIGASAQSGTSNAFAIGSSAAAGVPSTSTSIPTTLLNQVAWPSAGANAFAIGTNAYAASNAFAIGNGARARNLNMALGNSLAFGLYSLSAMEGASALGNYSVALGYQSITQTTATGGIALGYQNSAGALSSVAIGRALKAHYPNQVVMGVFNTYPETVVTTQSVTDPVFVIGNGTSNTDRKDAFVITREGNAALVGTLTISNGKPVLTEEAADALYLTTDTADTTYLRKDAATLGALATATGLNSLALGNGSTAHAEQSIVLGSNSQARYLDQVVIGSYSDSPAETATERQPTDAIFVIGNGSGQGDTPRSNALVVKRNGDTQVNGSVTVSKDAAVTQNLSVTGTTTLEGEVTAEGDMKVQGVLRVKPAGDILMGEFDAIPVGVTPP